MKNEVNIGIVGAGGSGVVTVGEIILAVVQTKGYCGRLSKDYDAQIQGGGSSVKISFSREENKFPEDNLDILVCLSAEKFSDFKEELRVSDNTLVFFEEERVKYLFSGPKLIQIPFGEISQRVTGDSRNRNIVVLGLLLGMIGFTECPSAKILSGKNLLALSAGMDEATKFWTESLLLPSPRKKISETIALDGNSAISKAALRAGCKFAATYPITPASEIGEELSHELPEVGGEFVQAEDEIAAICMALGVSLAGVKAMTATSGPGFDLMTEGINLGSACEISIVIIEVQRAGPSTGMSTKTEQSDLSGAIFSGHGYAPRVVLAPSGIEGCYRLAIEAFNIAEEYQVPVTLLSDQYLAKTIQVVSDFTKNDYLIKNRLLPSPEDKNQYLRYRITPNFISPVALPGTEGFTWRATGLTHDEKGNPRSESFEWQQKMQEKITKKLDSLRNRRDLVKVFEPKRSWFSKIFGLGKPRVGLISWGSSGEVSLAAVKSLGLEKKIKVCIPELIDPMPKEIMAEFLKGLKKLIVVEMNYSGQYHGFLRRYFDLPKKTFVCKRAGGRPWSQKEIADFIKKEAKI